MESGFWKCFFWTTPADDKMVVFDMLCDVFAFTKCMGRRFEVTKFYQMYSQFAMGQGTEECTICTAAVECHLPESNVGLL